MKCPCKGKSCKHGACKCGCKFCENQKIVLLALVACAVIWPLVLMVKLANKK